MLSMNFWDAEWDLDVDVCPCDVHFNEWIAAQNLTSKIIYHFGTGTHHVVGIGQAENGSGNKVLAVTASKGEYDAYVDLVTKDAAVARAYVAYFGDIYLTDCTLLPDFDIVTMFHLCEFTYPNTDSTDYGGLTDRGLLDVMTGKLRPGGYALFYTGSIAFDRAEQVIADWAKGSAVERVGEFKTLLVYRKRK
jgi:hypothetical protein